MDMIQFLDNFVSGASSMGSSRRLERRLGGLGWGTVRLPAPWECRDMWLKIKWSKGELVGIAVFKSAGPRFLLGRILPGSNPRWDELAKAIEAQDFADWQAGCRAMNSMELP